MRRALPGATLLVVVALGFALGLGGYVTRDRNAVSSNPGLGAFTSIFATELKPGALACVRPVSVESQTTRARFRLAAPRTRVPPLTVTLTAPGYRATDRVDGYPPEVEQLVEARFPPPGRDLSAGQICWHNDGERAVTLLGTDEGKSVGLAQTTVDGAVQDGDLELTLLEARPQSLASRSGQFLDRASALSGLPETVLWLVLVAVLALPFLAATALVLQSTAPGTPITARRGRRGAEAPPGRRSA